MKGCRSAVRCRVCGEGCDSKECKGNNEKRCLGQGAHAADFSNCPAKARELQILEIGEHRRCSPKEAVAEIQARNLDYASITARHIPAMEGSLSASIAEAINKAMEKVIERLAGSLYETLTHMLTNQMAHLLGTAENLSPPSRNSESKGPSNEVVSDTS